MKCYNINCNNKAIIRFEYKVHKEAYCLDHLIERLEYIRDNEFFHLIRLFFTLNSFLSNFKN